MTTRKTRIEQALAFGRSITWICRTEQVDIDTVTRVMRGMDQAAAHVDQQTEYRYTPELENERHTVAVNAATYRAARDQHPVTTRGMCGSHMAYVAHRYWGEPIDDLCVIGERVYQRLAKRRQRAAEQRKEAA